MCGHVSCREVDLVIGGMCLWSCKLQGSILGSKLRCLIVGTVLVEFFINPFLLTKVNPAVKLIKVCILKSIYAIIS